MLLINKEPSSSKPIVFPVPPPDDLMQPPSQAPASLMSPKPNADPQNLEDTKDTIQGQPLSQTPVTEMSTGRCKESIPLVMDINIQYLFI